MVIAMWKHPQNRTSGNKVSFRGVNFRVRINTKGHKLLLHHAGTCHGKFCEKNRPRYRIFFPTTVCWNSNLELVIIVAGGKFYDRKTDFHQSFPCHMKWIVTATHPYFMTQHLILETMHIEHFVTESWGDNLSACVSWHLYSHENYFWEGSLGRPKWQYLFCPFTKEMLLYRSHSILFIYLQ